MLLRSGLDETLLHCLAVENRLAAVAALIRLGASVKVANFCQGTPLLEATLCEHVPLCRLLIAHAADVNARNNVDQFPLSVASRNDHTELIAMLVAAGADINAKDGLGMTAFDEACTNHKWRAAGLLLQNRADIDSQDTCGDTPLHRAAYSGDLDGATFLLLHGSNPSISNGLWTAHDQVVEAFGESPAEIIHRHQ